MEEELDIEGQLKDIMFQNSNKILLSTMLENYKDVLENYCGDFLPINEDATYVVDVLPLRNLLNPLITILNKHKNNLTISTMKYYSIVYLCLIESLHHLTAYGFKEELRDILYTNYAYNLSGLFVSGSLNNIVLDEFMDNEFRSLIEGKNKNYEFDWYFVFEEITNLKLNNVRNPDAERDIDFLRENLYTYISDLLLEEKYILLTYYTSEYTIRDIMKATSLDELLGVLENISICILETR